MNLDTRRWHSASQLRQLFAAAGVSLLFQWDRILPVRLQNLRGRMAGASSNRSKNEIPGIRGKRRSSSRILARVARFQSISIDFDCRHAIDGNDQMPHGGAGEWLGRIATAQRSEDGEFAANVTQWAAFWPQSLKCRMMPNRVMANIAGPGP
jgi:hypothetical protein